MKYKFRFAALTYSYIPLQKSLYHISVPLSNAKWSKIKVGSSRWTSLELMHSPVQRSAFSLSTHFLGLSWYIYKNTFRVLVAIGRAQWITKLWEFTVIITTS